MKTLAQTPTTSLMYGALTETAPATTMLAVTSRIGAQQYGLSVSTVVEIVRLPALLTLAGAPPTIIGLLNLRGHYLPVLDGAILLNEAPTYQLSSQIIILGQADQAGTLIPTMGLRVDQVIDVRTLQIERLTPLDRHIAAPFLQGVINDGNDSILLFHPATLLDMVPHELIHTESEPQKDLMQP